MMKNKWKLFSIIAVLSIFTACSEQSEMIEPQTTDEVLAELPTNEIYVTDEGVLNFPSMKSFTSTIMQVKDLNAEEVISWNNQLGFTSFLSEYRKALDEESKIRSNHHSLIDGITSLESQEEADLFESEHRAEIKTLQKKMQDLKSNYQDFALFSNNRITGMRTYDPILAGLIDPQGIVIVEGSTLQYTEDQLKVMANAEDPAAIAKINEANEAEGIFIRTLTVTESQSGGIQTEQEQLSTDRCSTQFYTNKKMTGNSTVRNTVVPVYNRVWVPRVCEWICEDDGGILPSGGGIGPTPIGIDENCFEYCVGGFYRNVLVRYDITNTRLEATLRNYKIRCFFGCWEEWDSRESFLTISGTRNETISVGKVEKHSYVRDIGARSSGSFVVEYKSLAAIDGICFTQINW